jgi:hypothetical protein
MESVTADRTFLDIEVAVSVNIIRELGSGADLDIFCVGFRSERTRGHRAAARSTQVDIVIYDEVLLTIYRLWQGEKGLFMRERVPPVVELRNISTEF